MTLPNRDELNRVRFMWPEPLVIELLREHYVGLLPGERGRTAARLHAELLRGLVECDESAPRSARGALVDHYRALGLQAETIAQISNAVLDELMRIVGMRFRTSPRLREVYSRRLVASIGEIAAAGEGLPQSKPRVASRIAPRRHRTA